MIDDERPVDDDYEVGYGRPPIHTQFKPGQSGNPKGRPKKSKNVEAMIQRELDEIVTLQEGGQPIRITKREAIIKQLVNLAIKGNPKPLQMMYAHLEKHREPEPFVSTAADDEELLKFGLLPSADSKEADDGKD